MANPRQRAKRRSGSHKPVRHSKHAKKMLKKQPPIRGSKILQDAWDRHKTVKQNYDALGLVSSLNPTASGGTEQELRDPQSRISSNMEPYVPEGQPSDHIPKGHGRIIRDEDGNVIGMEVPEDETTDRDKKTYYEADDDTVTLDERTISWVQIRSNRRMAALDNHLVVQDMLELEKISEKARSRDGRFVSVGEKICLQQLVAKHKDDYEAMARDRKTNADQRTAGELARAIRRAGGLSTMLDDG